MKNIIKKQFGNPSGIWGIIVGWILVFNNKERSEWAIKKLKFKSSDTILEIGYGSGSTIKMIAEKLTTGLIAGIDHSDVMFKQASRRNKKFVNNRKVKLEYGSISDLKYPKNYFDIIFGSNVHFFWENPSDNFKKLIKLLKHNGRLIMIFQPRWIKTEEEIKQVTEKIIKQYEEVGLKNIKIDFKKMNPVTCIFVSGIYIEES